MRFSLINNRQLCYLLCSKMGMPSETAADLLDEVKSWDKENIAIDAIVDWVSMKYKGRTFGYLGPRRKFFGCQVPDGEGNWPWLTVHNETRAHELENLRNSLRKTIDKFKERK